MGQKPEELIMHIEKVTRYVNTASPSRSSSGTITVRKIPLSLPRVRWLERDPDYKPSSEPEDVKIVNGRVAGSKNLLLTKNMKLGDALTNSEQTAYELAVNQKLSHRKACTAMGITHSTFRQHLIKAKFKLGIAL